MGKNKSKNVKENYCMSKSSCQQQNLYLVYVVSVYFLSNRKYIYRVSNKGQLMANCYQTNKEKLLNTTHFKMYTESKKYLGIFIYRDLKDMTASHLDSPILGNTQ